MNNDGPPALSNATPLWTPELELKLRQYREKLLNHTCCADHDCCTCGAHYEEAAAAPPVAEGPRPTDETGFHEQTEARWQTAIYKKLQSLVPEIADSLDGSGCESGDALDVTLAEVEQAIGVITDARAEALGLLPGKLQGVQALADEKCRCFLQRAETAERQLDEARRELRRWTDLANGAGTQGAKLMERAESAEAANQELRRYESICKHLYITVVEGEYEVPAEPEPLYFPSAEEAILGYFDMLSKECDRLAARAALLGPQHGDTK